MSDKRAQLAALLVSAGTEVKPDELVQRDDAVETALQDSSWRSDPGSMADLVRMSFGLRTSGSSAGSLVRQHAISADPQFANGTRDHEVRLLAIEIIRRALSQANSTADFLALACLCAGAQGHRTATYAAPLTGAAESYRRAQSLSRGRYLPLKDVLDRSAAAENPPATEPDDATKLIGALTKRVARLESALTEASRRDREEAQIAWWVLGEFSRLKDVSLKEIPRTQLPFLLAHELSSLTTSTLGPFSARSVLTKMFTIAGQKDTKIPLKTAVGAIDRGDRKEWAKAAGGTNELAALAPTHLALRRASDVTGDEWIDAFNATTGLDARQSWAPIDLAFQYYLDSLLTRCEATAARLKPAS